MLLGYLKEKNKCSITMVTLSHVVVATGQGFSMSTQLVPKLRIQFYLTELRRHHSDFKIVLFFHSCLVFADPLNVLRRELILDLRDL